MAAEIERGSTCCCPRHVCPIPILDYESAEYNQRFIGFKDYAAGSPYQVYRDVELQVTHIDTEVINHAPFVGDRGYRVDQDDGGATPPGSSFYSFNSYGTADGSWEAVAIANSTSAQSIGWFTGDDTPLVTHNVVNKDPYTDDSTVTPSTITVTYDWFNADLGELVNDSITFPVSVNVASVDDSAIDADDTFYHIEIGGINIEKECTINYNVTKDGIIFDAFDYNWPDFDFGQVDATYDYTNPIDDAYMLANMSLGTPLEADYIGGSTSSSITIIESDGSSDSQEEDNGMGGTFVYNYWYTYLKAVFTRVRIKVPDSHKGTYYEFEYEIYDDEAPMSPPEVEGSITWVGPGLEGFPDDDSWYTNWIDFPTPENGKTWKFRLLRYKCVHSHPWTEI